MLVLKRKSDYSTLLMINISSVTWDESHQQASCVMHVFVWDHYHSTTLQCSAFTVTFELDVWSFSSQGQFLPQHLLPQPSD